MSAHPLTVDTDASDPDWRAIEDLLDEIARAAKLSPAPVEIYRLLLERIVPAAALSGGAVWRLLPGGELRLEYQVNLAAGRTVASDALLAAHQPLVDHVLQAREPRLAPPDSGAGSGSVVLNPTDCWLVGYPFAAGPGARGVIELVQRRAIASAEGRGYVRLLAAVGELLEDFHRQGELTELRGRDEAFRAHEQFSQRAHESLDLARTAYTVANEGRRVIDCDRLSVLISTGARARVEATSGVDLVDRRAKVVVLLEQLVDRCLAAGESLWHADGSGELPPEIDRPLHAFLDESQVRSISIVPLAGPRDPDAATQPPRPIGALAVEQFQAPSDPSALRNRVETVASHASLALSNALTHSRLPLAWLGRMLARVRWLAEARQLPKTLGVVAAVSAVGAALALVPADFDIEARGELQPLVRRDVFASDDGIVSQLRVDHGQAVTAKEPLIELRKPELDLEFRRVLGEIRTAEKKLAAVEAKRLENAPNPNDARADAHQMTADLEELKEQLKGLREQLAILEQSHAELVLRSPIDGQAITWNLKQQLEARPVERGQSLLTVADLSGPWIIELHLPDYRAGHVLAAREKLQPELNVSFALTSDPGAVYEGQLTHVAMATEADDKAEGPTLLATVAFDRDAVAGLRPGATVIARVHCGRRSIGYVWLHDAFEFIQSHWWW